MPSWQNQSPISMIVASSTHTKIFESMESKGYKSQMNVMDNQATKYIKKFLAKKNVICRW
jgi:hypothetical protein